MAFFGRKKEEADFRAKVITYKRVFGTPEGTEVLFDLMNRNFILNPTGGDLKKEGRREAVLDILSKCHINVSELDKLMKGDSE